jgi:hypothetical protein
MDASTQIGNITIPPHQDHSPAGHENIAFRPACRQLVGIGHTDGNTYWSLAMPDGAQVTLAVYPTMPESQAHTYLDAEGFCKLGGSEVPIVYTAQVPQRRIEQPKAVPDSQIDPQQLQQGQQQLEQPIEPADSGGISGGLLSMIGGSIFLIAIAYVLAVRSQGKPTEKKQPEPAQEKPETPVTPANTDDLMQQILNKNRGQK